MSARVVSLSTYYGVFGALIALTLLTVRVSSLDLGAWHTAVGLTIACCKALLVALVFMHLRSSSRLTWVIAVAGLFWLGILLGLTLSDYLTRHWMTY